MDAPTALTQQFRLELTPRDSAWLPIRIIGGPQVVLGRNREQCDVVSWFLPRNEINDRETLKLSQVHAYLDREGESFRVRDADSAQGTYWNGMRVPLGSGVSVAVGVEGRLSLGRHFLLDVKWPPSSEPAVAELRAAASALAFRHCLWMLPAYCGFRLSDNSPCWLAPVSKPEEASLQLEFRGGTILWITRLHPKGAPLMQNEPLEDPELGITANLL